MASVASLRFHDVPDYDHFREIFSTPELSSASRAASSNDDDDEVILSLKMEPSREVAGNSGSKNLTGRRAARSKRFRGQRKRAASRPSLKSRPSAASASSGPDSDSGYKALRNQRDREVCVESLKNPTPVMIQLMARIKSRASPPDVAIVSGVRKERFVRMFCHTSRAIAGFC